MIPSFLAMRTAPDAAVAEQLARTASRFCVESLTAVQVVLDEIREIAEAERRNAALRQLSTFLSDPSLAPSTDNSSRKLRLVVEQAREIFGADCAQATAAARRPPPSLRRRCPKGVEHGPASSATN